MKLIITTRPSALARWQTQWVINALQRLHLNLECEEKVITTQGDKILDKPLPEIGDKGVFTQELKSELLNGSVHYAVHSLKDLLVDNPAGLAIGCIPARAHFSTGFTTCPITRPLTLNPLPRRCFVVWRWSANAESKVMESL